jgi:purine-binding chemotaxis protein CheW
MQIVVFRVGRDDYALPLEHVREIVPYRAPRSLPVTRPWELGVISLREQVVPVWELAVRLGLPAGPPGPATVLVLVDEGGPVALVVDGVGGIHEVGDDTFEPLPLFPDALGVVHLHDELVVVLDLDKLLGRVEPPAVDAPVVSEPAAQARRAPEARIEARTDPRPRPVEPDILDGLPKHELQRRAREAAVAGRSSMSRQELIEALRAR